MWSRMNKKKVSPQSLLKVDGKELSIHKIYNPKLEKLNLNQPVKGHVKRYSTLHSNGLPVISRLLQIDSVRGGLQIKYVKKVRF